MVLAQAQNDIPGSQQMPRTPNNSSGMPTNILLAVLKSRQGAQALLEWQQKDIIDKLLPPNLQNIAAMLLGIGVQEPSTSAAKLEKLYDVTSDGSYLSDRTLFNCAEAEERSDLLRELQRLRHTTTKEARHKLATDQLLLRMQNVLLKTLSKKLSQFAKYMTNSGARFTQWLINLYEKGEYKLTVGECDNLFFDCGFDDVNEAKESLPLLQQAWAKVIDVTADNPQHPHKIKFRLCGMPTTN